MKIEEILHHITDAVYAGPFWIAGMPFVVTKHLVMLWIASLLLVAGLSLHAAARRRRAEFVPRGFVGNAVEEMVILIRDTVLVPNLGEHEARKFLPFFLSLFLLILTSNLLGLIPPIPQLGFEGGTATGNIAVNFALAVSVFLVGFVGGMRELGPIGFFRNFIPLSEHEHWALKLFLGPVLFVLEFGGSLIRHAILAVRLFANMIAGHGVILIILGMGVLFQGLMSSRGAQIAIGAAPLVLSLGIYGLEVLVCLIQACVFLFLSVLFVSAAVHSHH